MFTISLPNPWDIEPKEFFSQMRIVLKAAEKTYEDMVKGLELNEDNRPYISFRVGRRLEDDLEKKGFELTGEEWQRLYLEINRV